MRIGSRPEVSAQAQSKPCVDGPARRDPSDLEKPDLAAIVYEVAKRAMSSPMRQISHILHSSASATRPRERRLPQALITFAPRASISTTTRSSQPHPRSFAPRFLLCNPQLAGFPKQVTDGAKMNAEAEAAHVSVHRQRKRGSELNKGL